MADSDIFIYDWLNILPFLPPLSPPSFACLKLFHIKGIKNENAFGMSGD